MLLIRSWYSFCLKYEFVWSLLVLHHTMAIIERYFLFGAPKTPTKLSLTIGYFWKKYLSIKIAVIKPMAKTSFCEVAGPNRCCFAKGFGDVFFSRLKVFFHHVCHLTCCEIWYGLCLRDWRMLVMKQQEYIRLSNKLLSLNGYTLSLLKKCTQETRADTRHSERRIHEATYREVKPFVSQSLLL